MLSVGCKGVKIEEYHTAIRIKVEWSVIQSLESGTNYIDYLMFKMLNGVICAVVPTLLSGHLHKKYKGTGKGTVGI